MKLTLDDGHDGTLLDSRRALETVGIDTWMRMLDMSLSLPLFSFSFPSAFASALQNWILLPDTYHEATQA